MILDETTGEEITLEEAISLTKCFQSRYPDEPKAFFIGSANVKAILDQECCVGIRIYNGLTNEDKRLNPLLVGVDKYGKDMTDGLIMDRMLRCPTHCDPNSPLV